MPAKLTTKTFIDKLLRKYPDNGLLYDYQYVDYITNGTKIKIYCRKCDKIFEQTPGNHMSGIGCSTCSGNEKLTTKTYLDKLLRKYPDSVLLYDYQYVDYVRAHTKIKIYCRKCDKIFEQTPNSHMSGIGCPNCAGNIKLTTEQAIGNHKAIHGDKYSYHLIEYISAITKWELWCNTCQKSFWQRPNSGINNKVGCPTCAQGQTSSKGERDVLSYIQSIYSGTILPNDRTTIKPYELDGYMPEINKAVEFNGTYTHGDKRFYFGFGDEVWDKDIRDIWERDELKAKMCLDKGIKLLVIWEYDWIYNREWCEQMIYNHIYPPKRKYVRKVSSMECFI